ncbi:hypothetical protein [Thalassotalea agariperforans]
MKIYNKTILAATVTLALSACGGSSSEDNNAKQSGTGVAPVVSGDIAETFSENDIEFASTHSLATSLNYTYIDLMEGVYDPDTYDRVRIKNITPIFSGPDCLKDVIALAYPDECGVIDENTTPAEAEEIRQQREAFVAGLPMYSDETYGFQLQGNRIKVTPSEFRPLLNKGEYAEISYMVTYTDGTNDVDRKVTVRVDGDGSAPVAGNTIVAFPTERTPTVVYNLLKGATDADNTQLDDIKEHLGVVGFEELYAGNARSQTLIIEDFTAEDSYLSGAYSFDSEKGLLTVNPIVYQDVLEGQTEQVLKFNYNLSDGKNLVPLTAEIRIQGLYEQNPPAATGGIYFGAMSEIDDFTQFDLSEGVEDPENDSFSINEVVAGSDVPAYAWSIDGSNLVLDPHAFASHVNVNEEKVFTFMVDYIDSTSLVSYEKRKVEITVKGEETNLIAAAGVNWDFEDPEKVGALPVDGSDWIQSNGWIGAFAPAIDTAGAYEGSYGLSMVGDGSVTIPNAWFPDLEEDKIYFLNMMYKNFEPAGAFFTIHGGGYDGTAFWSGIRPDSQVVVDQWVELQIPFSTRAGGNHAALVGENSALTILEAWHSIPNGDPMIDNVQLYTHTANNNRDIVANEAGLFEDDIAVVQSTGGGTVSIDAAAALDGSNFGLMVDTTGKTADDVVVKLPMKPGAIQVNGRYVVELDIQHVNGVDGTNTSYHVEFQSTGGKITRSASSISGANETHGIDFLNEATGANADVDWQNSETTLNIVLSGTNAQYYIDNVRVYAAP